MIEVLLARLGSAALAVFGVCTLVFLLIHLVPGDPVAQREVWRQEYASPWNGGTLATAGGLVFQGSADGRFIAYDAESGEMLWSTPVGSGVVAAPVRRGLAASARPKACGGAAST